VLVRVVAVLSFALVALGLAGRRGWVVGVVAAILYGLIAVPPAISWTRSVAWSRRHPLTDGAALGPLAFLLLAYVTRWPLWVCVLLGLAGVGVGVVRGMQRRKAWSASS
jgi:hypothetical protein